MPSFFQSLIFLVGVCFYISYILHGIELFITSHNLHILTSYVIQCIWHSGVSKLELTMELTLPNTSLGSFQQIRCSQRYKNRILRAHLILWVLNHGQWWKRLMGPKSPCGVGNKIDAAARSMAASFWRLEPNHCTGSYCRSVIVGFDGHHCLSCRGPWWHQTWLTSCKTEQWFI